MDIWIPKSNDWLLLIVQREWKYLFSFQNKIKVLKIVFTCKQSDPSRLKDWKCTFGFTFRKVSNQRKNFWLWNKVFLKKKHNNKKLWNKSIKFNSLLFTFQSCSWLIRETKNDSSNRHEINFYLILIEIIFLGTPSFIAPEVFNINSMFILFSFTTKGAWWRKYHCLFPFKWCLLFCYGVFIYFSKTFSYLFQHQSSFGSCGQKKNRITISFIWLIS